MKVVERFVKVISLHSKDCEEKSQKENYNQENKFNLINESKVS